MSRIHKAWEKIPLEGELQLITADEVRNYSGKEPRLMMKFDHSSVLPPALRETGRFILPLKNGLYAIIKGEGYHCPEWCGEILTFNRQTHFELKTTSTGLSEMQHLDIAFNTGLLAHFLEEPILYPTIRGRKRSPQFSFRVGNHQLEATGVQVEIDGGFEGRNSVTLVEAKIGECDDFHLRQLYYPLRFWSTHTRKSIRPLFFTYCPESEIYRFREYRFEPEDVYQKPHLVKAAAYRISDSNAADFEPLSRPQEYPFPQADRLDKVALIPFLAAEGETTPEKLAPIFDFSPRQGRYYLDACRALGLIDDQGHPTQEGMNYIRCAPEVRHRLMCKAVMALPVMQEILTNLLLSPGCRLEKSDVEQVVQRATSLSPTTAGRRTQTVWSWLSWVANFSPLLQVTPSEVSLRERPASPGKPTSASQLELF